MRLICSLIVLIIVQLNIFGDVLKNSDSASKYSYNLVYSDEKYSIGYARTNQYYFIKISSNVSSVYIAIEDFKANDLLKVERNELFCNGYDFFIIQIYNESDKKLINYYYCIKKSESNLNQLNYVRYIQMSGHGEAQWYEYYVKCSIELIKSSENKLMVKVIKNINEKGKSDGWNTRVIMINMNYEQFTSTTAENNLSVMQFRSKLGKAGFYNNEYVYSVNEQNIRLRSQPLIADNIIKLLKKQDIFRIVDFNISMQVINGVAGYWVKIILEDGSQGWIWGNYIDGMIK